MSEKAVDAGRSGMAPEGCELQPDGGEGIDTNGNRSRTYVMKGPYDALRGMLTDLRQGDAITDDWAMVTANLVRRPGGTGVLTLVCAPNVAGGGGGGGPAVQKALSELWTLRSVRNDMSIFAYCGPSASNPSRTDIEAWMNEPDGELAAQNKYRKPDGTVVEISDAEDLAVMGKIRRGVESVMRFYPMLTKTRTYAKPPDEAYKNLARIDTPSLGALTDAELLKYPGNLSSIISGCEWLKCQDDCQQTADGKWQRIESWMGLPKTTDSSGWDKDFYGENPWSVPYGGEGGGE